MYIQSEEVDFEWIIYTFILKNGIYSKKIIWKKLVYNI